ncbi:peptidoglycan-binding protein [Paenibacillus sp. FJAT-26967]|uniref:peptidoglycan-binding domain-containing protein n=1 Tax=Paenibacillus sp. FJAT-26967 TaxID=1729690 RepID=UPI00083979CF|nr:peptidoglycan-binding domain-containing protein [Paenibacillus sp. FJAT-26967]
MKNRKRYMASVIVTGALAAALATSAFAASGHNNVAAVGTAASNTKYGTNYQGSYSLGQTHAQIAKLKQNLKDWRAYGSNSSYFTGVAAITSTDGTFDQATKNNLIVFQNVKGLTADGIYGAGSRNAMHAAIGSSPKGFVRIKDTSYYINYNDTAAGLSADNTYKLDHSWLTSGSVTTLNSFAQGFYSTYSKKLEINDGSLIDGDDTPEHSTHQDGKGVDIRNAGLTVDQQKKVLQLAVDNPNISSILYYTNHGLTSSKIVIRADHDDHFHVNFK